MAICYMYRHQHAGIVTSHVFRSKPTPEQLAPLIAECERLHGREGWGMVHEAEMLDAEIPHFPERPAPSTHAFVAIASVVGTVTPSGAPAPTPEPARPGALSRLVGKMRETFRS